MTCDACLWTAFPDVQPLTELCLHETLGREYLQTNMETQSGKCKVLTILMV